MSLTGKKGYIPRKTVRKDRLEFEDQRAMTETEDTAFGKKTFTGCGLSKEH